jgi:hypothetical protein
MNNIFSMLGHILDADSVFMGKKRKLLKNSGNGCFADIIEYLVNNRLQNKFRFFP